MTTKTELRKLAQQSTRFGYFDHGATLSVNCPACRKRVTVSYSMWTRDAKGRRMTKVAQLRAEVLEHLQWDCDGKEVDTVQAHRSASVAPAKPPMKTRGEDK